MTSVPFQLGVPDRVLADLDQRLANTGFTRASSPDAWAAGVDPTYLRHLVTYWSTVYDWRTAEAQLNRYDMRTAQIDGRQLHFVVIEGDASATTRIPLLMLHGWPSTFTEMQGLGYRLAHPSRFGVSDAPTFDVVIPSLPGFPFSEPPSTPLTTASMAEDFHALMTELGHERYGIFGGDIGGGIAARLAVSHPESVIGLHLIDPPWPSSLDDLTEEEAEFLAANEANEQLDNGYNHMQSTRPDTIAAALMDSPAGLLAWIIDKYRSWSDCHGDLESRFDRDYLLTVATLFWVTGSIGTSFRSYFDATHSTPRGLIEVPVAVTLSQEPGIKGIPRSLAERAASDIRVWHDPGTGGHFMAYEEPDLTAATTRAFFASL